MLTFIAYGLALLALVGLAGFVVLVIGREDLRKALGDTRRDDRTDGTDGHADGAR